jgi:hypothetical protein
MVLDGLAAVKFLMSLKIKHVGAILRAHFSFYRMLPAFLSKRKFIQNKSGKLSKSLGVKSIVFSYYIMGRKRLEHE